VSEALPEVRAGLSKARWPPMLLLPVPARSWARSGRDLWKRQRIWRLAELWSLRGPPRAGAQSAVLARGPAVCAVSDQVTRHCVSPPAFALLRKPEADRSDRSHFESKTAKSALAPSGVEAMVWLNGAWSGDTWMALTYRREHWPEAPACRW